MTEAFRTFYDAARALFPLLPQWYVMSDDCVTPEYRGRIGTMPQFCVPKDYTLMPDEPAHEAGHLYLDLLTGDPLTAYWTFRGFPATWQQALAGSQAQSGNEAWMSDPRESWAECFARAVVPTHGEKTLNWGKDVDPLKARAFFQSLAPSVQTPVQPPTVTLASPQVFDVRDELPRTDWEIGRFGPKTSRTYHWNGPALPTDVAPLELILGDAHFHVSKDWSPEPGIQGGDGIMYHKLIAPNGDLYITRDADAVLWACGSALGNAQSEHVQVMCGGFFDDNGKLVDTQKPTVAQLATMRRLERDDPLGETYPHRIWSATTCPGPDIAAWVEARAWKAEELAFKDDPDAVAYRKDVKDTLDAVKAVLTTLASQNRVEDDALTTLGARIDKLHAI